MVFRDCTARHGGGLDAQVFVGERRVLITMKTGGFVLDNVTYGRSSKKKKTQFHPSFRKWAILVRYDEIYYDLLESRS